MPMISADGNISAISLQTSSVGSSFKCQQAKVERRIRNRVTVSTTDNGTQHHERMADLTWPERDQQSEDAYMLRQ